MEFPGSPVVRTRCFHCWGPGSVPGGGTRIPQPVVQEKEKKREREREREVPTVLESVLNYYLIHTYKHTHTAHLDF